MSSHDSIGIVFKCMLKGAVDFLVKPVRKNELRNLWQHVWRKNCVCYHLIPCRLCCSYVFVLKNLYISNVNSYTVELDYTLSLVE